MLDIKFIRENPDAVRENIKKKFQDAKLPLVDEVLDLDSKRRAAIAEADQLRSNRNTLSKQIGMLMGQAKKDPAKLAEAEAVKQQVKEQADRLAELEKQETELEEKLHHNMLLIPQMIDSSVPIGKDDSENVEIEKSFIPILLILSPIISLTSSIKIESSSIIAIFIILIFLSPKVFSNQSNNPITCLHLKKINHFFQH